MRKICFSLILLVVSSVLWACKDDNIRVNSNQKPGNKPGVRVPAEWEKHKATWMQWPGSFEKKMRPAFAKIIAVVQQYETVHLLIGSEKEKTEAQAFLKNEGVIEKNIIWHIVPTNNAWMRDNGPIYVTNGTETWIQNWKFDGWDKSTGTNYQDDNKVPLKVGQITGLKVKDHTSYVLEKGNLEVNGAGTGLLNWDCQLNRNPQLSKAQQETILKEALGLKEIIWAYGYHPKDITTGHIDGIARFANANTVVISEFAEKKTGNDLETELIKKGYKVIWYPGDPNWLVGNGFVVAKNEGKQHDDDLKKRLQTIWPNRDIHLIDVQSIANSGGGIHCVTNDQPASIK